MRFQEEPCTIYLVLAMHCNPIDESGCIVSMHRIREHQHVNITINKSSDMYNSSKS